MNFSQYLYTITFNPCIPHLHRNHRMRNCYSCKQIINSWLCGYMIMPTFCDFMPSLWLCVKIVIISSLCGTHCIACYVKFRLISYLSDQRLCLWHLLTNPLQQRGRRETTAGYHQQRGQINTGVLIRLSIKSLLIPTATHSRINAQDEANVIWRPSKPS